MLWLSIALVAAMVFGACGLMFLASSSVVIAVAMIRKRGWVAVAVLIVLAVFFGVPVLLANRSNEAEAAGQLRVLRMYAILAYMLLSAPGMVLAAAYNRKWPYGRAAYLVSGLIFAIMTLSVVLEWELWQNQVNSIIEEARLTIHGQSDQLGESLTNQQLAAMAWLSDNKAAFGIGLNFLFAVTVSCVYVTVTNFVLRLWPNEVGFLGSFKDMRPTEWLVWGAIAAALLCFADYRWPEAGLRFVAWNSAIVLTVVYWFNGLSVLMYGVRALQPTMFTFLLVIGMMFLLVNAGALPVLALVGLFDTWGDYRRKIDALIAARLEQENERRGPPGTGV